MLSLSCRDTAAKKFECDYVATGMTEEELWDKSIEHGVSVHGLRIEDVTHQFKNYYKQFIKRS
jgi:predicted small metal-binding protein